ncbi:MAG: tetratricopeptide repeat protein [Myxococcota bacterium]
MTNKKENAHSDQTQPPTNPQGRPAEQTDALRERGDRLAAGVAAHGKWVLIIAVAVTLLGAGYAATQAWQRKADEKASDAYAEAVTLLEKGLRAPDSPKNEPEDNGEKTHKAAAKTKELQQARQRFHQLRLDYPRARVAELARLQEARLSVELGETKEAIAAYTTFLKRCRPQTHVCALGVLGKAAAQESLGDTKQALATLEQYLTGGQHQPGEPLIRWHIVRLAHTLGLQEKARAQGMWLKENAPNAWVTSQADALVGLAR